MNIKRILADYDAMFGKYNLTDIETYLCRHLEEARMLSDTNVQLTLLNEIIGFCRDTSQKEKALNYCNELKTLLQEQHLEGCVDYATSLMNIANAYRAFGLLQESAQLYETVLKTYQQNQGVDAFMYASLYNNWSLVYQEAGDHLQAAEMLTKALQSLGCSPEMEIPQATTRVNLAGALLQSGTEQAYGQAMEHLRIALDIFEKDGGRDFHYSAALVAMGDACSFKKDYQKAADYYKAGLEQIEKHTGQNANYAKVLEKYNFAKAKCSGWVTNLQRSKEFYETYGKPMIQKAFPEYEHRIAVGLAGEGSDCFGFDDEISTDHDYGIGFCMWLTEEDYKKIGAPLQAAYEKLVETVYQQKQTDRFLQQRRGAAAINGFYNQLLRTSCNYEGAWQPDYYNLKEFQLAAAVNGQVFRDDLGIFTSVRNQLLTYYPDDLWRKKIAQEIHEFSQYAQSNYPRMMARGDQLTANLCISKAAENTMNLLYLLNRRYAPYYKWKKKGLAGLSGSAEILAILEQIMMLPTQAGAWEGIQYNAASVNRKDQVVSKFEEIAQLLLKAMKKQGMVSGDDIFLESHVAELLQGTSHNYIEKIIALEWKQFDQVHNEGGRAFCQDDYETFRIMRESQYRTWPEELLKCFHNDLLAAEAKGWNLITEKYARMMKDTDPNHYATLEANLPVRSEERQALQEVIIKIQVGWMDAFAAEYPKLAGNARNIRSAEDGTYNTSYETYLRGEMGTYSEETFLRYAEFVTEKFKAGQNLHYEVMENTVRLYGYTSLQHAEQKL